MSTASSSAGLCGAPLQGVAPRRQCHIGATSSCQRYSWLPAPYESEARLVKKHYFII